MDADEKIEVELAQGMIDSEGITQIFRYLRLQYDIPIYDRAVEEIGVEWQTKRGNFTRRLSSYAYKKLGVKLPEMAITQVGNLARVHSASEAKYTVEFTRQLNEDASYFYNDGSCWWSGYADSRCALKSWGGLGMRSFTTDKYYPERTILGGGLGCNRSSSMRTRTATIKDWSPPTPRLMSPPMSFTTATGTLKGTRRRGS